MTLKHLHVFIAVCEEMSMTRAAKRLYMTQPAVSRMIKELETHYQTVLFERINHQLYLTAAGNQMFLDCQNVFMNLEQMEHHLSSQSTADSLKVGCSIGIGISYIRHYLDLYYEKYPETRVYVTENNSSAIEEQVVANQLDIGVIEGPVHWDSLISIPFLTDDVAAACAPCHPMARYRKGTQAPPLSLAQLNEAGLCLSEHGTGTREQLELAAQKAGIQLTPRWSTMHYANIFEQVRNGSLVTLLSRHLLTRYFEDQTMVELETDFQISRTFHVIWHKYKYLPANGRWFVNLWNPKLK